MGVGAAAAKLQDYFFRRKLSFPAFLLGFVRDKRIVSTGYIGAPRKTLDCFERGDCLRRRMKIPSGHRYELCRSVHAEMNAIINAAREGVSLKDSDMYIWAMRVWKKDQRMVNAFPCFLCKKMIINAGISKVYSMTEEGRIRIFDVEKEWVKAWQNYDMLDDMDIYDNRYHEVK